MDEKKRYFGKLIFPENPNLKLKGAWLKIDDKSISVEAPWPFYKSREWDIVLGEFNGIDKATFVRCRSGQPGFGAGGTYTIMRARFLIKGTHIHHYPDLTFTRLIVFSPALRDWIRINNWIETKGSSYTIPDFHQIVHVKLPEFDIIVNKGHSTRHGSNLEAKETCTVQFICKTGMHLNDLLVARQHFKKLVLFLTNSNPEFDSAYLNSNEEEFELKSVFFPLKAERFSEPLRLEYRHLKNDLAKIIESWFLKKEVHPVIDLVLEKSFNIELSGPAYFLNVCVATETFHRKFGKVNRKKIDPHTNKQVIVDRIKDDAVLLAWFEANSEEWEKPTLIERLNEFRPTVEGILGSVFPFTAEEFLTKVKQTRNDMAHEADWRKRFSETELFLASKVLEYMLRIEVLKLFNVDVTIGERSLLKQANANIEMLARGNNYNQKANLSSNEQN